MYKKAKNPTVQKGIYREPIKSIKESVSFILLS